MRSFKTVSSLAEIPQAQWDHLNPKDSLFTSYAYLKALEDTACVTPEQGWQSCHLGLFEDEVLIGAMPLYVKYHSQGEYVFDHAWARAYEQAGGHYYPKLLCASALTPVTGTRLLAHSPEVKQALCEAAIALTHQFKLSSAHIHFPKPDEAEIAQKAGFSLRQDLQFWWENRDYSDFDAFLSDLSSNRRKVIKRERREVQAHIEIKWFTGAAIEAWHLDHLYDCIEATYDKKWGKPYLTRAFFDQIHQALGEDLALCIAFRNNKPIAASVHFQREKTLYGRQWGCLEEHEFLHFELCYYQAIDWGIAHGMKRIEAGTQGYHKLSRGYLPHFVYSAHYIADKRLRDPVERFLEAEFQTIDQERHHLINQASPFKQRP